MLERKKLNSIDQMNLCELMISIVDEIKTCEWLRDAEKEEIVFYFYKQQSLIFSSEIATRFNDIQLLLDPNSSAKNIRRIVICIFRKIRAIRDEALDACRKKKKSKIMNLYL